MLKYPVNCSMVAGTPAKVVGFLEESTPSETMKHGILISLFLEFLSSYTFKLQEKFSFARPISLSDCVQQGNFFNVFFFFTRGSFYADAAQDFCQELEEAVRRQVEGDNLWGGAGI